MEWVSNYIHNAAVIVLVVSLTLIYWYRNQALESPNRKLVYLSPIMTKRYPELANSPIDLVGYDLKFEDKKMQAYNYSVFKKNIGFSKACEHYDQMYIWVYIGEKSYSITYEESLHYLWPLLCAVASGLVWMGVMLYWILQSVQV